MLESGIAPIQIDSKTRVKAYLSTDSYSLDEIIGDMVGVFQLSNRTRYDINQDNGLNKQLGYILSNVKRHQEHSAMGKYLELNNKVYLFKELQGYSQGEWADVVIYADKDMFDDLTGIADTLDSWFKGDVYTVHLEKLQTYINTEDLDRVLTQWETEDCIGGIVLNDEYTLEDVAKELI